MRNIDHKRRESNDMSTKKTTAASKKAEQQKPNAKAPEKKAEPQQQKPVKPKMRKVRYAVLADGGKHVILRQDGKYLYCEDTTIRLASTMLKGIETAMIPVEQ